MVSSTCAAGGEPGDIRETDTYYYVNGSFVSKVTNRRICCKDGHWHQVAQIVSGMRPTLVNTGGVLTAAR